jgi:hypothetical protein
VLRRSRQPRGLVNTKQPVVVAEEFGEEWREGDGAGRGGCLGWSEPEAVGGFVKCAVLGVDDDDAVVEVDVVALEAGEFAC